MTLTKRHLVTRISEETNMGQQQVFDVVQKTLDYISEALAKIKEFSEPRRRRLLVVEDNKAEQMSIGELLGHDDIELTARFMIAVGCAMPVVGYNTTSHSDLNSATVRLASSQCKSESN